MLLLLAGLPLALLWQVYVARQLTRLLNIHQIEEYQNGRFWRWARSAPTRLVHGRHVLVCLLLVIFWLPLGPQNLQFGVCGAVVTFSSGADWIGAARLDHTGEEAAGLYGARQTITERGAGDLDAPGDWPGGGSL